MLIIDPEKIHWSFWQSRWGYDYGNGYVCLFDTQITESKQLPDLFERVGAFDIYKKFKMYNGKMGINPQRHLLRMFVVKNAKLVKEDDFRMDGIASVYNSYLETEKKRILA